MSNNNNSVARSLMAVALMGVALMGCGKGSSKNVVIDGVDGPKVNFVDNKLTMAVVIKNLNIDFGTRIPVPHMPNSFLEVGPDLQSNGFLINIGLDAADVKALAGNAINTLDPTTLPGGRPLPGVAAGQLPGMAIEIPKLDHLVFYAGPEVFGVFVPVKLPFKNYIGTFRFYDGTGTAVGNISIVGEDTASLNSGFLLLVNLKGKVGNLIAM
jgi:hypothetical protein